MTVDGGMDRLGFTCHSITGEEMRTFGGPPRVSWLNLSWSGDRRTDPVLPRATFPAADRRVTLPGRRERHARAFSARLAGTRGSWSVPLPLPCLPMAVP